MAGSTSEEGNVKLLPSDDQLIDHAYEAMKKSYSPYSKFPVGAALLTNSGEVFLGTNVENASYGATICAERSAIVSAVTAGYRKDDFQAIAIIGETEKPISPCGICRQVLMSSAITKQTAETRVKNLLEFAFTPNEYWNR